MRKLLRRTATAGCALTVVATTFTVAGPAHASSTDLYVDSPERVVVNQAYEFIPWRITGPRVSQLDDTDIYLEHAASREEVDSDWYYRDGTTPAGMFKVYDSYSFTPGVQKVRLENSNDFDYNNMTSTPDYITIKYGTRSELRVAHSGANVTLTGSTGRYDGPDSGWEPHAGATMRFQKGNASVGWTTFAQRVLDPRGMATVTIKDVPLNYRVVTLAKPWFWECFSAVRT